MKKESRAARQRIRSRARHLARLAETATFDAAWNRRLESWRTELRRQVVGAKPGYDIGERIESALSGCDEKVRQKYLGLTYDALLGEFQQAVAAIGGPRCTFVAKIYHDIYLPGRSIDEARQANQKINDAADRIRRLTDPMLLDDLRRLFYREHVDAQTILQTHPELEQHT